MPSVRISKADVGSFAAFCASLGETRLRRSYGGRHSRAGDSLGVADFEDDRLKRNVPDRGSSVEKLHVTDAIAIDSAVGVTEYDPGDPLGRLAGLLMHPTKEANAGRPTPMGGHGSCLVNTSGDRDVVNAAGDIAGDGLVFPAAAIVGEGIQTTLAFDHIAMQEQRVVNANAVHAAFEAYSLLRPGSQGSLEWRVCIVVSIQIDESLAGKTVIPILQPVDRSRDRGRFSPHATPAEIEQVATPHAEIRLRDRARINSACSEALHRLLNRCRSEMKVKRSTSGSAFQCLIM